MGLTCSADASVIAASVQGPAVFVSLDSGATWTSNYLAVASGYFIASIAMSADGSHICAPNYNSPGGIVCSSDFGHTWVTHPTPTAFHAVTVSADGQKIAALPIGHVAAVFTSADFGGTWISNQTANTGWSSIAASADGSKIAAPVIFTPYVMTSTNYGATWTSNLVWSNASCYVIASSVDGSSLITGGNGQIPRSIYTSANGGATWNSTGLGNAGWNLAASSADGSHLVAGIGGALQISTNFGLGWNPDTALMTNGVAAIASSADGGVLLAATGSGSPTHGPSGGIYIKRSLQQPTLNIVASEALNLSWLIPSTNFVLQQCTDLASASWTTITNAPTLNLTNLQNQIVLPLPGVPTFYRLSSQ